jgi:hypothetical protein
VTPKYCDFVTAAKTQPIVNIFDGELVLDRHQPDTPIYLVFDALVVGSIVCLLDKFNDRLLKAHIEVRKRIRE